MIETFRNAWKVPELRRKLLFTFFIIIIYRIGGAIPVPYLDTDKIREWFNSTAEGSIFAFNDMLSGGTFSKVTLFALSVTPYINAQIIIQLLTYALPPLERLQKEGMEGRKKINKITKYAALVISALHAWGYYKVLGGADVNALVYTTGWQKIFSEVVIITCFVAGSSLTIWLGDLISEKGIGNGISILLFAGIVARIPSDIGHLMTYMVQGGTKQMVLVPLILVIYILMIIFIVFMNESERRVPIQYAKRVVGRKQYAGQNTFMPIKVCMSGVMPIIFAMAFMSLPQSLRIFIKPREDGTGFYNALLRWFAYDHPFYGCLLFLLIIGFNYFYVSIQYNPVEIANNLRQSNGGVPGIRPGKPTVEYFQRILSKITLVGAVFLGLVALFPIIYGATTGINTAMGGTSILIVVSVALETARTMESQMMMRHHKGFLE